MLSKVPPYETTFKSTTLLHIAHICLCPQCIITYPMYLSIMCLQSFYLTSVEMSFGPLQSYILYMILFMGLIWDASVKRSVCPPAPVCPSCPVLVCEMAVEACACPVWPLTPRRHRRTLQTLSSWVFTGTGGGVTPARPPSLGWRPLNTFCEHLFLTPSQPGLIVHSSMGLDGN